MGEIVATATKRILIVDDDEAVIRALSIRCEHLGLKVDKAHNADQALLRLQHQSPDLLLLDFNMPGRDGLTLCEHLRTEHLIAPVPVILLTGQDAHEIHRRCQELGVYYVRKDVNAWQILESLIRRLLVLESGLSSTAPAPATVSCVDSKTEASDHPRKKILIIDDDPAISKALKTRLNAAGYEVFAAYTGMQGYWMALREQPDLIILDFKMPEGWGNAILGKLKMNPLTRETPVLILSGMTDLGVQRDVIRLGAELWINKPFDLPALLQTIDNTIG